MYLQAHMHNFIDFLVLSYQECWVRLYVEEQTYRVGNYDASGTQFVGSIGRVTKLPKCRNTN